MAPRAFTNAKCYLDAWDISGDLNAIGLQTSADPQDATVFGLDTRKFIPGLKVAKVSHAGIWQTGTDKIDEVLFSKFALQNTLMTVAGETGAEGEIAYFLRILQGSYNPMAGGQVGELLKFAVAGEASDSIVRGILLTNALRSSTGNGTIFNPGAVAAGQKLYAGLHVLSVTGGPTVTVKIQSAATGGFGSPTDRITFAGVTVKGSQWATPVAGAITDAFWRATWTFAGGAGPTCLFLVTMGIQ